MMTILAKIVQLVGGSKLLPAGIVITILTLGHQWWIERDGRMQAQAAKQAKTVCEAEHKLALVSAERDHALNLSRKKDAAIEFERQVAEELRGERKSIVAEFEAF